MALVAYSDSEESDDETTKSTPAKVEPVANPPTNAKTSSTANTFSIDKSNPGKIRVNLQPLGQNSTNGEGDDNEPATKRPRLGPGGRGGAFSGFNAMLPAPKRDADKPSQSQSAVSKAPPRKVFSLRTGAEPGFSRESDAELKDFFAEQERLIRSDHGTGKVTAIDDVDTPARPANASDSKSSVNQHVFKDNTFMFKPLSVARSNVKKKKTITNGNSKPNDVRSAVQVSMEAQTANLKLAKAEKIDLFSIKAIEDLPPDIPDPVQNTSYDEVYDENSDYSQQKTTFISQAPPSSTTGPQSLSMIADDLGLSAADRRHLFGRDGKLGGRAVNVINFNTDQEYAANEELRASGQQVQHNPVRAIAPGKHSLKQLVSAASGQKDALEESFATGRRNKKEAGNKYGW